MINSSGVESGVEMMDKDVQNKLADRVELDRLKKECAEMINTLKALDQEEKRLREGNHVLAQQAVIMGCTGCFDSGARRSAGRKRPAPSSAARKKEKTAAAKSSSSSSKTTATSTTTTPSPAPAPAVKKQESRKPPPKPAVTTKTRVDIITTNQPSQSRRKCEHIIKVINRHGIFTNPIHPARIAEGFVDLTIHMRVIQRKIQSNSYAGSFELFKSDIRQMFDSCAQGSNERCPFYGVITELKKMYEFELANFN